MSIKVAFIGAGSIGFTRTLIHDILSIPELRDCELALMDIDAKWLNMVKEFVLRDINGNHITTARLTSTTNRREALRNANYVFCTVRVGGTEAYRHDIEIPLRYGVDQCVGDTICAGGLMYGQRGIAFMLGLCKDIREVAAPDCLLLNYANPMAMMTWAALHYGKMRAVGLCHGVQGGHGEIAEALHVPKQEIEITAAGINHQTWFIKVTHKGKDMLPKLLETFEKHPRFSQTEKVRIDMLRRFGLFSTESNGHLSEYLPWYRKRPKELKQWIDMRDWILGETAGYLRVNTETRMLFKHEFAKWVKEPAMKFDSKNRWEHGSYIIEALETGRTYRGHLNVINNHSISNLPNDAIVEIPCYVDKNGISITRVGALPLGPAAVCNASISAQRLAVEAAVHGDDTLLKQAMMMDPLTGAVCTPPEIWQMVDELLVAQEKWLPQYKKAIVDAKKRLRSGKKVKTRNYKGAARKPVRTVKQMLKDEAFKKQTLASDKAQGHQK